MRTIVLSAPGREAITDATIEGLARQNPEEPFTVHYSRGEGGKRDFWAMLWQASDHGTSSDDLLLLEDDIVTAKNFIAYARRWPPVFLTSFFNGRRMDTSIDRAVPAHLFAFSQAIKVPTRLACKLTANGPTPPEIGRNQDDALGWELQRLGELVYYHRSLVQHVGDQSLVAPGEKLEGLRVASDFVGEEFDCLAGDQSQAEGSAPLDETQ